MSDDRRIEARGLLVGTGAGTTPERIAEIEKRSRQLERMRPAKRKRKFADVLAGESGEEVPEAESSSEEPAELPKGPSPRLAHPTQRRIFGRESDEPIILKG